MAGESTPEAELEIARKALKEYGRREPSRHPLVIALVAPVGTDLDSIERRLAESFRRFGYGFEPIRLSALLDEVDYGPLGDLPAKGDSDYYEARMDAGDQLRSDTGDGAALAAVAIARMAEKRRSNGDIPVAYLLRSLKHPAEVNLLRHVYTDAFTLVGVATSIDERRENLANSLGLFDNPDAKAVQLIERDEEDAAKPFGQHVRDVFVMADAFLLNSRGIDPTNEIDRLVDTLFGAPFITPSREEEAMRIAWDASLRSAAVGRQVGAALVPALGTPIIIGTNEVSKPGGGQYWTDDEPDFRDFRLGADPNPLYIDRLVQEFLQHQSQRGWLRENIEALSGQELLAKSKEADEGETSLFDEARTKALIEFTRCVHAEQAAIINAARAGVSTEGARLFSTTFPCHECAKMIVGAGIVEVQYIEPYPKSLVRRLYRDLINVAPSDQECFMPGGKIPFRSFRGIAPRRYGIAFTAGVRKVGNELVEFNRPIASPRSGGWSEAAVRQKEDTVSGAIGRIVVALAEVQARDATPAGDAEIRQATSENADNPAGEHGQAG